MRYDFEKDERAGASFPIADEMADGLDEELEMEIDDHRLDQYQAERSDHPKPNAIDRRVYFAELLRLQGELLKLQDWV